MKKLVLALFIATGSLAMAQIKPDGKKFNKEEMQKKMEMKEQQRLSDMQKELNLNQAQVDKIKNLHEQRKSSRKTKVKDRQNLSR